MNEGIRHRKQQPQDVEATFAQIKSNHHFKRLRLSGLPKVVVEVGLACIAHNLRKMVYKMTKTTKNHENKRQNKLKKSKSTPLLKIYQQYPKIYSLVA